MSLQTKFLDYMELSEFDESTESENVEENEEEEENVEENEEQEQKKEEGLIRKMCQHIEKKLETKLNEICDKFFERTNNFWEMSGKTADKMGEVFDKAYDKMEMLLIIPLAIGLISVYALVVSYVIICN